jgi:HSP20 family protein
MRASSERNSLMDLIKDGELAMFRYAYRPTRFANAVNRLFDESVVNPQLSNPTVAALPLDVAVSGDAYIITAAVPGLKAEDLHLEVLGDTVNLRGELPAPEAGEKDQWLLRERRFGKFVRSLTLPTEVAGDQAEASVEQGVLTVRLPKVEAAKAKSIKVLAK